MLSVRLHLEHLSMSIEPFLEVEESLDDKVLMLSLLLFCDFNGLIGCGLVLDAWVCNCSIDGGELILLRFDIATGHLCWL